MSMPIKQKFFLVPPGSSFGPVLFLQPHLHIYNFPRESIFPGSMLFLQILQSDIRLASIHNCKLIAGYSFGNPFVIFVVRICIILPKEK